MACKQRANPDDLLPVTTMGARNNRKTHRDDEPNKDHNLDTVWVRNHRRRDVRPVQGEVQQANPLRSSPEEVDFMIVGSEPAKRCQGSDHGEEIFRKKLPGERGKHDDVKDL